MKETYTKSMIEVIELDAESVVLTSGGFGPGQNPDCPAEGEWVECPLDGLL